MAKNTKKGNPGAVIKAYREMKFLTQQEVADMVGVSQQQYQKYESWKSKPRFDVLDKLIKKLEIPPYKIFDTEQKIIDFIEIAEKKIIKHSKLINMIENDPKLGKMIELYSSKKSFSK